MTPRQKAHQFIEHTAAALGCGILRFDDGSVDLTLDDMCANIRFLDPRTLCLCFSDAGSTCEEDPLSFSRSLSLPRDALAFEGVFRTLLRAARLRHIRPLPGTPRDA